MNFGRPLTLDPPAWIIGTSVKASSIVLGKPPEVGTGIAWEPRWRMAEGPSVDPFCPGARH